MAPRSDNLATITTDTGDFAPGHETFTRYTTPHLCRVAALSTRYYVKYRKVSAQEAAEAFGNDPRLDTLPSAVVSIARACGARFTIATTAARDLPGLFDLALLEANDSLAQAVLARQLAIAGSTPAKLGVLQDAIATYLAAEPARVAAAERVVAMVDTIAPAAVGTRLLVRKQLLDFYAAFFDRAGMRREIEQVITLGRRRASAPSDQNALQVLDATYRQRMTLAFVDHPDSMPTIAAEYLQLVPALGHQKNARGETGVKLILGELTPLLGNPEQVGRPTPHLPAEFWFPAGRDTVQPESGKVSLLVRIPDNCLYFVQENQILGVPLSCQQLKESVQRWQAQYGGAGLALTVVASAARYILFRGPLTAAQAAGEIHWYVNTYLALPVRLAVQPMPTFTPPLPAPDGRIFRQPAPPEHFINLYGLNGMGPFDQNPAVVLTGQDGREVYAGPVTPVFEVLLRRMLTPSAVAVPNSGAPSVPAASDVPSVPRASVSSPADAAATLTRLPCHLR